VEKWDPLLCFCLDCVITGLLLARALRGKGGREKFMKALGGVCGKAELLKEASLCSDEVGGGGKVRKKAVGLEKVGEMLLKYGRPDLGCCPYSCVVEDQNFCSIFKVL